MLRQARWIVLALTVLGGLSLWGGGSLRAEEAASYVTLEESVEIALERHYGVRNARLSLEEAEVNLRQAEANNLVQPSPVALVQARYQLEIARRSLEIARLDAELEAKESYFAALRAHDLGVIVAESIEVLQRQLSVARQRFENGTGTRADLLQAEHQLASTLADQAQAAEGYELALRAFRRSLGLDLDEPVFPAPQANLSELGSIDLEHELEEALLRRVEILQIQAGIEAAGKQVEVAHNDYTPALALEAARIALARAESQFEQARTGIELEIRQAYSSLRDAERRLPVLEMGVALAEEELHVAQQLYEVNMAPIVQVMAAQAALSRARAEYTHGVYDLSLALARFERAVVKTAASDGGR